MLFGISELKNISLLHRSTGPMRNFRNLYIWKRSFELVKRIYILTDQLPDSEKYGLKSQVNRAAVSLPTNIAEGCGRGSDKDLQRFLSISLGSAFELETQLLLIKELFNIPEMENALAEVKEVQRMISGYSKYLSAKT